MIYYKGWTIERNLYMRIRIKSFNIENFGVPQVSLLDPIYEVCFIFI